MNATLSKPVHIRASAGERLGTGACYLVAALLSLICVLPFLLVLVVSFSSEKSIVFGGYSFFPSGWSLNAYKTVFSASSSVPRAYLVTGAATVTGTLVAALITFGAGYALANKTCLYRNGLALYFFFTTVFSSGLVPWYMMCKTLGCYDNLWALIVPSLMFSPFNMFLVRNFVRGIPEELNESARIDGAGEVKIAFSIYFPLCLPVLATITLFYAINYWNNYFNAVMLVNDRDLYTLQMLLFMIQSEIKALNEVADAAVSAAELPKESFKMATAVVTMGPIIILYPFLQKYFVKGMVVGAVKG